MMHQKLEKCICKVSIAESLIEVGIQCRTGRSLTPSSLPCKWEKMDYTLYIYTLYINTCSWISYPIESIITRAE
ncbi:unnamed protein product [Arabis nemorensis]|uniref:Uncharacterized protein n=1 Tax=Arabis nemorensis TaxID=586526 RepID=A0A565BVF7_9BRAS|nr:unnamed protein product [Arabis nemorensis]